MMFRREVVLGGSLTLLWGACACPAHAQLLRKGHQVYRGCLLSDQELDIYYEPKEPMSLHLTGNEPIISKSGNPQFDYALAHTLARLTATFQVLPGFAYYDDHDGMNAWASSGVRLQRADGTVLFGVRMLKDMMSRRESPEVAVTAVCAHEYGHILQYKRALANRLMTGQRTVKRVELHADYLAGYYAGIRKREKRDYPAAVFATTAHSIGDYNVNRRDHHGTPDERATAIVQGFKVGYEQGRPLDEGVEIGVSVVSQM